MIIIRVYSVAWLFLNLDIILCAPISKSNHLQLPSAKVLNFMKTFGYITEDDGDSEALYTENGLSQIIKTVQRFGAIEETGKIDNATLKLMSSRRCGVPDIIKRGRRRRYAFGSEGWSKRNLTFFIANWTPHLGEYAVTKNILKALNTWGSYGRLNFRRVQDQNADIVVAFATGSHGDSFPFDGPGGVLAHAFFPSQWHDSGGDIHFDADEAWVDKSKNNTEDGTDFYVVALHELGHSLGLAHSPVPSAVMFPYYRESDDGSGSQLDYDDILGMYNLYITRVLKEDYNTPPNTFRDDEASETSTATSTARYHNSQTSEYAPFTSTIFSVTSHTEPVFTDDTTSETATTETVVTYEGDDESVDVHKEHDDKHNIPKTNSPSLPNICDGYVDAIATLRDQLFVFKEQFIWRYKEKGRLEPGYPVKISEMFHNLPKTIKKIDAAYEKPDGNIILFTGNKFWISNGTNFIGNSPRPLTDYGLPDYLNNIDAVQKWGRNGKTYFYKTDRFWRYNETAKAMDPGYPLHMERWRGVPENIDAATTWKDSSTYFFKGELFWKFDNNWVIVTEQSPLPTAQIWFGCPEEEQKMISLFPE